MRKNNAFRIRFLVMLGVLVIIAIGYFTGIGLGNICGIGFDTITLLCPVGALLSMVAERTAIPMAIISIGAVLIVCIILGKVFCSWICPVHFMTWFREKAKRKKELKKERKEERKNPLAKAGCQTCKTPCGKSKGIKIDSRHGILAAALGSTLIFGFPVFCLICPVGLTFASVLLTMRLFAFGETTWTIIVFPLIILLEILLVPKWCKRFCPISAILSLFSGLNKTFRPTIDAEKCIRTSEGKDCTLCAKACPEGINLYNIAAGETTINDCTKCRACSDACPQGAITFPLLPKKKEKHEHTEGGETPCPSSLN